MIYKSTLSRILVVCISVLVISCNKINTKRIIIEDQLTSKSLKKITEIKLDGVEKSDYVLFGGDYFTYTKEYKPNTSAQNFSIKHPYAHFVQGKNSIFLRANMEYSNEFYVVRRVLKKEITCTVEMDDKAQKDYKFPQGKTVTFVWSSSAGAKGWYKFFEKEGAIDALVVGEEIDIMRISTNKSKMTITNTDNVTSISSVIQVIDNVPVDLGNPNPAPKPLVFEPKERVGICTKFKFPGTNKMHLVSFKNTLDVQGDAKEYSINSNF